MFYISHMKNMIVINQQFENILLLTRERFMGGRGTYALGNIPNQTYRTVGHIEGIKILKGVDKQHSLPVESNSSRAYIKLKSDGTFHEMRFYNEKHLITHEIAYHPEGTINNGDNFNPILHVHEYAIPGDFKTRTIRLMTEEEKRFYKKYLIGVDLK